jgi:hypothetical protein
LTLGVCAAAAAGLTFVTAPAVAAEDLPLPSNMIFFMAQESCPPGSSRATQANGRLIVSVKSADDVGNTVGQPLADMEDREHEHQVKMTVFLPERSISGAPGGLNGQATGNGTHEATVTADSAPSGLPFIQLLACQVN